MTARSEERNRLEGGFQEKELATRWNSPKVSRFVYGVPGIAPAREKGQF
jgi:hypothetical protein